MKNWCLSSVFGILSLAALSASTATSSLTYAARFGHFVDGAVETCPISGDVELTVALYGSEDASAQALWSHRLTTTAYEGDFAVEISDSVGVHDDACPGATYSRLDRLFSAMPATTAFWVEISNVKTNGVALSALATGALQRGKITGVPFAVVAARAESARGSFRVSGKATVSVLKATGRLDVSGDAAFLSSASFNDSVKFTAATVSVTGTLHKTTLADLGTLEAGRVVASKSVAAEVLAITNGAATTLTPSAGSVGLTNLTVAGTFSPSSGTTVSGTLSGKSELNVAGTLSVPDNATIGWTEGGALSVPDGAYPAGYKYYKSVNSKKSYDGTNETGGDALMTISVGKKDSGTSIYMTIPNAPSTSSDVWCRASRGAFNFTMLVPLGPGDKFNANNGAINHFTKELSK